MFKNLLSISIPQFNTIMTIIQSSNIDGLFHFGHDIPLHHSLLILLAQFTFHFYSDRIITLRVDKLVDILSGHPVHAIDDEKILERVNAVGVKGVPSGEEVLVG